MCIRSELYILHVAISLEGACDLVTYIAWISLINSKLGFMICISIALLEAMKFQKKNLLLCGATMLPKVLIIQPCIQFVKLDKILIS